MSVIILTPPPPTKPPGAQSSDPDGFAQDLARTSPYAEARALIDAAEAAGQMLRIYET